MSVHYARFPAGEEITPACFLPITTEDWKRIQASMRRRVSGAFISVKMNAALPWRKQSERDLLALLEVDPNVDTIEVLPHQVLVEVEGKQRHHFPSFQIRTGARTAILDAISNREADDPARDQLTRALKATYLRHGIWYAAIPSRDILLEPRFSNVRYVLRAKGFVRTAETARGVVEVLSEAPSATIADIRDRLPDHAFVPETVCSMALARMVDLDLGAPEPTQIKASLRMWETV